MFHFRICVYTLNISPENVTFSLCDACSFHNRKTFVTITYYGLIHSHTRIRIQPLLTVTTSRLLVVNRFQKVKISVYTFLFIPPFSLNHLLYLLRMRISTLSASSGNASFSFIILTHSSFFCCCSCGNFDACLHTLNVQFTPPNNTNNVKYKTAHSHLSVVEEE